MTRPSPELEVKVEYDVETNTWVACGPQTLVSGYGDSAQNAVADYRDNLVEQYNRLVELGESKVAPGLWRTVPLLSQAVEMIDAINKA